MPSWNGDALTFAEVVVLEDEIIDIHFISATEFVLIASGCQRSRANLRSLNLFTTSGIPNCICGVKKDGKVLLPSCPAVEQLWKLRYAKNPYSPASASGWAGYRTGPDDRQKTMLAEFGITRLNDLIWGDKCFDIIRATNDPKWVGRYR